jgi:head-tail adaptor
MKGELAGTLSERVEVQRRDGARDALGGAVGDWASLGFAWAGLRPDGTGAAVAGGVADSQQRWRVTLRARDDLMIDDRILWSGRRLRVLSVTQDPGPPDRILIRAEEER